MTTPPFLAGIMGLGGPEMVFVFILLLLLFGFNKLPELGRGMGKSLGEFKKARQEFEEANRETAQDDDEPDVPRPVRTLCWGRSPGRNFPLRLGSLSRNLSLNPGPIVL